MLLSKSCLVATQVSDLQQEKVVCEPALTLGRGWSAHVESQPVPEQLTAIINSHCSLLEASNSSVWVSHCKCLFLPCTSEVTWLSCPLNFFYSQYLGEVNGLSLCQNDLISSLSSCFLFRQTLTSASGPNRVVREIPASVVHNCCTYLFPAQR